ncbi:MAG: AAA family ATPase, partial [Candidatus Dadabacteria bacterium]|nr:AAA family ATPase [Candidatus Dadabacteria bacterium]
YQEFAQSRKDLEKMLGGRIIYNDVSKNWEFKKANQKFTMGTTAEGIKKVAILDTLLGNRYLDTDSVIFIDEPESALHPKAISDLLDIIALLAQRGMQFFLSSHSYFVVKKLFLVAQSKEMSIPVISITDGLQYNSSNLKDEWPDNPIIDESIRLYKEEVKLALK